MRARRRLTLALAPTIAAALLSLHACERLFPEHPVTPPATTTEPSEPRTPVDHGDTPEQATRIVQGSPQSGAFETADDVDYFQVEVADGRLLYVSTDQGKPHHQATLISVRAAQDDTWSGRAHYQFVNVRDAGTYYIKLEPNPAQNPAPTPGTEYDLAVWLFGPENATFDIQLRYSDSEPSASQKRAFRRAAEFWERALIENNRTIQAPIKSSDDSCPGTPSHFGELVDDLLIDVVLTDLGGPESTLAQGGYCIHRVRENGQPDLPVIAIIEFDIADIGNVEADGVLYHLAIHEMAHALGFGMDLWDDRGYLVNPIRLPNRPLPNPPPDTHFAGPHARREFDAAGGTFYTGAKVPVENDAEQYGEGSLNAHWRETVFEGELMTASPGADARISRVTLGSLEDLGYAVNYDAADQEYRLPRASGRSSLHTASGIAPPYSGLRIANDLYPEPPRPLELPAELVALLGNH